MKEYQLYINGTWVDTRGGNVVDDLNPADGTVYARAHMAGSEDVDAALHAAQAAFPGWAATLADRREKILLEAADNLQAMFDEAVEILVSESGSARIKARAEVTGGIGHLRCAAGECRRIEGTVLQPTKANQLSMSIRQPLGVAVGIAPFNYPLLLALKKVAYALAAGCAFILKPASATPASGCIIAKIFHEAGLPAGVLNVVPGPGDVVGDRLVEAPQVKIVTFTGSSAVGRSIAAKAAYNLKKFVMELGGKNPLILLADYDLDKATEIAGYGAFLHQGQLCMATSRIIAEAPVYEEFCRKMALRAQATKVGDPRLEDTFVGPLINAGQCGFIDGQIRDAVAKGARLLAGGTFEGPYFQPTVLADVTTEMRIFHEESFGPVTSIIRADTPQHALELCNDNGYGLSASLLTNDLNHAMRLAPRIEAGSIHVNDTTYLSGTTAPFGGLKMSGFGKEGGRHSIEDFTELKWLTVQYEDKRMP